MDEFTQWMLGVWLWCVAAGMATSYSIHKYQYHHLRSPPLWQALLSFAIMLGAWPFYVLAEVFDRN